MCASDPGNDDLPLWVACVCRLRASAIPAGQPASCTRRSTSDLNLLQQPPNRALLEFEIFGSPQRVDCMSYGCEHHPSAAVVVGPSSYRFGTQVLKSQAVDVFCLKQNLAGVLVVFDVMLFIVDHEILDALRNRV